MAPVEFHFDYGSPNCYLVHAVIPAIEQRTGVRFSPVPILLGGVFKLTGNQSPATAFAAIPSKLAYQQAETARFVERHAIARYRFNPHFPVNTILIMRAAIAAEQDGVLPRYSEAVFRAMWEDGLKMDEPMVVRATLDQAGLDGARLLAQADDPAIKDALRGNTERSVARGTFGAPTFFVGDAMFFGKDRLRDVEEAVEQRRGS